MAAAFTRARSYSALPPLGKQTEKTRKKTPYQVVNTVNDYTAEC
ncbi:hypothetical protein CRENPOLYSF1_1100002 [Crenothrix polyspora]|uniref:Uncharacterized protein n=1 Tax=Crenothrix polyspora TaxID=360316 RepID=A0A1R4GZI8_9GAMM|nr:hypothetical protein CRENPOLYSF1_1100002 [Crenothrix polyspora]